jgi:glycosyltransferase involved in cell wall biosynthesis
MSLPVVSVVIPTYNRAETIGRAIDSVLRQSYRNIEVIVVDDGSTDATSAVLARYGERIISVEQENGGPSAARNTGVRESSGEIVAFLDSDDTWHPDKIERQVRVLEPGGPAVPCCVCNAVLMDPSGAKTTSFEVSKVQTSLPEGFWTNPAPIVASRFLLFNQVVAVRRDAFERAGGFKRELRLLEDYDLAFRLALQGPWGFVAEPMVHKFNDSEGIGVQAMNDPKAHAMAWQKVLLGFAEQPVDRHPGVGRLVRAGVRDVTEELTALDMMSRHGSWRAVAGRMRLGFLRLRQKTRRRLPSWPKVVAVSPAEFTTRLAPVPADG